VNQPPDPDLHGVRALVTGRTTERVQDAATRIGHGTAGLVMDVRDEHSVAAGTDRALAALGGLDVLVNNAGQKLAPAHSLSLRADDRQDPNIA
jgi:3-oxoacyl-[acyl-carrier protein] reductase